MFYLPAFFLSSSLFKQKSSNNPQQTSTQASLFLFLSLYSSQDVSHSKGFSFTSAINNSVSIVNAKDRLKGWIILKRNGRQYTGSVLRATESRAKLQRPCSATNVRYSITLRCISTTDVVRTTYSTDVARMSTHINLHCQL